MKTVIQVDNVSKHYRLGEFSSSSLSKNIIRSTKKVFKSLDDNEQDLYSEDENDVWSLRDVSFDVQQGDTLGLIGRNGAGKSTLLKILSRITTPTIGEVKLRGRVASLLEVGTGFHPDLTGRDNIFLNGAILGMRKKEIQRKFDEIVEFSGVEKYIDTPVKRYSSGMYVRLAFSVAAHLETDILIVDEVLAVGDAEFQKKCIGKMNEVSVTGGKTILFVSHNIQAIKQLCRSALLLEQGKLITIGQTSEVVDKYLKVENSTDFSVNFKDGERGNSFFYINQVSILDANKSEATTYEISKKYFIEIKYTLLKEERVKLSLILSARDGATLFGSLNNHEEFFYNKNQSPGQYKATIEIPGNFFNNGVFSISLATLFDYQENIVLENLMSFETSDDGILKKDYFGNYGGYFRPSLKWETQII